MVLRCTGEVIIMQMYWAHENNKMIDQFNTNNYPCSWQHSFFCATFQWSLKVTSESPILEEFWVNCSSPMKACWEDGWTPYMTHERPMNDPLGTLQPVGAKEILLRQHRTIFILQGQKQICSTVAMILFWKRSRGVGDDFSRIFQILGKWSDR